MKIEKIVESCAQRFQPKSRFLMGLTLASIFHKKGKDAFIQNAAFLGISDEETEAMLVVLEKEV